MWCCLGLVGTWGQIALFEGNCPIGSCTEKASDLPVQTVPLQKPCTLSVYLLNVASVLMENNSFKRSLSNSSRRRQFCNELNGIISYVSAIIWMKNDLVLNYFYIETDLLYVKTSSEHN